VCPPIKHGPLHINPYTTYYLDAETLLVATYVWVDDELKALQAQGIGLPRKQKHQKATLAELLTLAIFLLLQGQDLAKGYLAAKSTLKAYFPQLPHLTRFYRVLQKAHRLLAHLALRLSGGEGHLQVVDLKPIPLAHGHRIHGFDLPKAAVGVGPLGAFAGYTLVAVMNEGRLFFRWAVLPGNAREAWAEGLLTGLPAVLGDRGFRFVEGVKTPPYRVRGGKVVQTGWKGWMGRVRNWIETRFSVMVRSLGLHRIEARSYWGFLARVNLVLLAHNPIRSRVLPRMAGVEM
jgi:hypothetical protein